MPKQNRPLVRDGRLQPGKKRTDRTYLRPAAAAATAAIPGRLPSNVRALQHQGVRRRREVDLNALAVADTKYALHELRRIVILTAIVLATLIVLAIVLR